MKTIGEYKEEFINLLLELEKEHDCVVNSVEIARLEKIHISFPNNTESSKLSCKIDIQ